MPGSDKVQFPVPTFKVGKRDAALLRDLIEGYLNNEIALFVAGVEDDQDLLAIQHAIDEFLA